MHDGAGSLFVSDGTAVRRIVLATGQVTTVVGTPGQALVVLGPLPASLDRPSGLAVSADGALFIVEYTVGAVLVARF